ncbi:hypothetical protein C0991_005728, partial [Blastosporella zonata]
MWSLKEWAQEMPYYKFFSVAMVPGQRSVALADINMGDTQEMPLFKEDNKDFETSPVQKPWASSSKSLGKRKADAISGRVDKDSIDEGLEGEIAVRCQQCTTAKVAKCFWNLAGDTAWNAQRRACVVRRREKQAAALAARAPADNEEGPVAGPSNMTLAALPTLGTEDEEEEVSGVGILWAPKLEERDDGAPVTPEGSEGPGVSESTKLVWQLTDKPATEFKWVTCRVGELQEMEASMADYAAACEQECANL